MTFALVQRELADLTRHLSRLDSKDFTTKENLIRQTEVSLNEKYLKELDRSNPSQTIVAAITELNLSCLRLTVLHQKSKASSDKAPSTFTAAISLLEAHTYHTTAFAPLSWSWIFDTTVPWLAIAIVLTSPVSPRAQEQIDAVFQHFGGPEMELSRSPLWQLLVQLRLRWEGGDVGGGDGNAGTGDRDRDVLGGNGRLFGVDDVMLDFDVGNGGVGLQQGQILFDDSLGMLDMDDMPWYVQLDP